MEENKQNQEGILLLFLSEFKKNNETEKSTYSIGKKLYFGRQTNEATCRYLWDVAKTDGYPIKKVIIIASEEVKKRIKDIEDLDEDATNQIELFFNRLIGGKEYKKGNHDDIPEQITINYISKDETGCLKESEKLAQEIYRGLQEGLIDADLHNRKRKVYIDYTGGMRDISFLMTSVIRFLEFQGVECGRVVYGLWNKDNRKESNIVDISYVYKLFSLINAVNDFVSTGNATALNCFYEDNEPDEIIKNVVKSIKEFSDSLVLCDVSDIEEKIRNVIDGLNALKKDETETGTGLYSEMFRILVEIIRKKMFLSESLGENAKVNSAINLKMIRWCIDNTMLQQALTLFVEKVPVLYLDSMTDFYKEEFDKDINEEIKEKANHNEAGYLYFEIFELIDEQCNEEKKKIGEVKEKLGVVKEKLEKNKIKSREQVSGIFDEMIEGLRNSSDEIEINNAVVDCLVRIQECINNCFDKQGKKTKTEKEYLGIKIDQNDIPAFIKVLWNDEKKRKAFLTGDQYIITNKENKAKNESLSKTYKTKKDILERYTEYLKDNLKDKSKTSLHNDNIRFLSYYLGIKMIRNKMNHAIEKPSETDLKNENEAKKFLERTLGIQMPINDDSMSCSEIIEGISSVLLGGIEAMEKLMD